MTPGTVYVDYETLKEKARSALYDLLSSPDDKTKLAALVTFWQAASELKDEVEYEDEEEEEDSGP